MIAKNTTFLRDMLSFELSKKSWCIAYRFRTLIIVYNKYISVYGLLISLCSSYYVQKKLHKKSWAEFFKHLQIKDKSIKADEDLILQECDQKSDQKST